MYPRSFALGLLVLVLAIATMGCPVATTTVDSDTAEPSEEVNEETETVTESEDGLSDECRKLNVPQANAAASAGGKVAVIQTSKGTIKFEFHPDVAPLHVANFIQLTECGLYDGVVFHRIGPEDPRAPEMVQSGDPLTKILDPGDPRYGSGGAIYTVPNEISDLPHLEGTVAMARGEHIDSASSQFYIAKTALPGLDGQYTVFGQVTEGLDVVKALQIGDVMQSVTIEDAS